MDGMVGEGEREINLKEEEEEEFLEADFKAIFSLCISFEYCASGFH